MAVYQLDDLTPTIDSTAWVADNAQVMGQVEMGPHTSAWFSSVIRGDSAKITIGEGTNIQDGSVLHVDNNLPLTIGKHVTVGHMVQLHGCTIGVNR
jgi:carbonic anhydrase/acetyltransferase-like protein (isoleucine patch superfamily)